MHSPRDRLGELRASAALRTQSTHRLEVELNRARFDQHGVVRHGVSADAGLVLPFWVDRRSLRGS